MNSDSIPFQRLILHKKGVPSRMAELTYLRQLQHLIEMIETKLDQKTITLDTPLPTWSDLGYADHTGFMQYQCRFDWRGPGERAKLALGQVCYAASVSLDGCKAGDRLFSPFELMLENLIVGEHVLDIDVLNTFASTVFGDPKKVVRLREARAFGGTYAPLYEKLDLLKLRSRRLEPVTLLSVAAR